MTTPAGKESGGIRIGYFGPADPAHPRGGAMWMGAKLAVEDANASGGYQGSAFQLLPRWSDEVWRAGASSLAKLMVEEPVCAVIGGIDSDSTHLATQIAAKMLVPVVDPVSTDESVNHAGVPWVFSWAPGNREIALWMSAALQPAPYLLVAGTDHDSRMLADVFLKVAARPPVLRIDTTGSGHPGVPRDADQVIVIAPPACTLACAASFPARTRLIAGPSASSRLCRGMRRDAIHPALVCRDAQLWQRLEARFHQPADAFAQLSYEAASELIVAIRKVGPNRAAIREALAEDRPPGGRRAQPSGCFERYPRAAEGESA
jgi:ABC-type branched-subunit amino acid transport system substrate-binding protein